MQPYFIPYIGYFQLINAVDKFVFYDDVNYINRGWVNRNQVLINGKSSMITIPLKEASQNKLIKDIEVSSDEKWKCRMLRTIELSYKKAPFFPEVFSIFEKILNSDYSTISQLNFELIKFICQYLEIHTNIKLKSSNYNNQNLRGQERILDICKIENADHYINPIGGIELYNVDLFYENKIKLNFVQSSFISYPQFDNVFVPNLSIIDLLMFCEPVYIKTKLLKAYKLI